MTVYKVFTAIEDVDAVDPANAFILWTQMKEHPVIVEEDGNTSGDMAALGFQAYEFVWDSRHKISMEDVVEMLYDFSPTQLYKLASECQVIAVGMETGEQ